MKHQEALPYHELCKILCKVPKPNQRFDVSEVGFKTVNDAIGPNPIFDLFWWWGEGWYSKSGNRMLSGLVFFKMLSGDHGHLYTEHKSGCLFSGS